MIESIKVYDKKYLSILDFLKNNFNYDFYIIENNSRFYITDESSLKKLFRQSLCVYVVRELGDYIGIIFIWKSYVEGIERYYVKINAINNKIAEHLITVLIWNYGDKNLFLKISKNNKFLSILRYKGFRFKSSIGSQIILQREPSNMVAKKKEENNEYK